MSIQSELHPSLPGFVRIKSNGVPVSSILSNSIRTMNTTGIIEDIVGNNDPERRIIACVPSKDTLSAIIQPMGAKEVDGNKLPGIAIIHLDPFIDQLPEYYNNIPGVTQIDYCEGNVDKCLKLIQEDYKEGRIFILSNGGLAREVVPKIHELPQLHAVYILCENVTGHREWSSKYSKVRMVGFDERNDRWPFFAVDWARTQEDFGDARAKAGNKDAAKTRYEKALEILKKVDGHDPKWTEVIKNKIARLQY